MIEVEIKGFIEKFTERYKEALLEHDLYGIEEFEELLSNLETLKKGLDKSEEIFLPVEEHIIDKFCLGDVVLKFVNSGYSHSKVSEILSIQTGVIINPTQIKEWVDNYSHLDTIKRPKVHSNLFDVQERMQDIHAQLQEHLHEIKNTHKDDFFKARTTREQVVLETYKEIRALIKDASGIIKAISQQSQLQEFRKVIIESIKEVSPATAQAIIRKLKQNQTIYSALLPPD